MHTKNLCSINSALNTLKLPRILTYVFAMKHNIKTTAFVSANNYKNKIPIHPDHISRYMNITNKKKKNNLFIYLFRHRYTKMSVQFINSLYNYKRNNVKQL